MRVFQLDQDYAKLRKSNWTKAFRFALVFIAIMWFVFLIDAILPFIYLNKYGIRPRQFSSLFGIVSAVFLHGGLSHIMSNSLPLLLAITALFGNYPQKAKSVLILSVVFTGLLVWLFARPANHIGASGLLYCLLTYVFVSGFIRKDVQSIGISLVIAFLYSSLIFGIIPLKTQVSWESHLFGMIVGVFLAIMQRKTDRPVFKVYQSFDED